MDRPVYDGVKYLSINDFAFSEHYRLAIERLNSNRNLDTLKNINEIIELYEIYQIVTCKNLKEEYSQPYLEKAKKLMPVVAQFFKTIRDDNFENYYNSVSILYIDEFWELFEKFSCFEMISSAVMKRFLSREDITLYRIIEHKKLSEAYNLEISDILRKSNQTAEMIISEYMEEHNDRHKKLYFPKNLSAEEYEGILQKYIDSDYPNAGILQLISRSKSSSECPISDVLRLNAKRKAKEIFSKLSGVTMKYGVGICFEKIDGLINIEYKEDNTVLYKYNIDYLEEYLDNYSIIKNFATIFSFVDGMGRSRFPSIKSRLSVFERAFGVKGVNEYKTGHTFHYEELRSSAIMQGYYDFLKRKGIDIESVIKWFFSEYLRSRYDIKDFSFNASSETSGYAEKCKNLCSEIEGILKQYKMYVDIGNIDRELFEIASSPMSFKTIPSQISNKYAYINSDILKHELFLLFSDQSMLAYIPAYKGYNKFADLIIDNRINLSDYKQYNKPYLEFLIGRNTISIDDSGEIKANDMRISLLRDLYDNDVICLKYCDEYREIIEELNLKGDIQIDSTLFTRPESDYLNYMLNNSTFSNGLYLRNRYAHGTYSKDENEQARDYISILKIAMMVLLKITEEFSLKNNIDVKS